jgi:lysozyme
MQYFRAGHFLPALTVAALISATASVCAADQILTNEPSRGDLFARLVKPAGGQSLLPQSFAFPTDTRDTAIFGIDISHYTQDGCKCQLDWATVPTQKVFFVYLKASQGTVFIDDSFAPNWALLQSMQNIHRGAYHFLSGDADPTAQAQHFLTKLGKLSPQDMPPCVDLEWDFRTVNGQQRDTWSELTPDQILERVQTWLDVVEKATGRRPLIYTNAVWWADRVKDATKFKKFQGYPIWIADYSPAGRGQEIPQVPDNQPWAIWQFTETGALTQGGVPGKLDVSIFKGTTAQFTQSFGLPASPTDTSLVTPPAPPTPSPTPVTVPATPATVPTTPATPATVPSTPSAVVPPVQAVPPTPATPAPAPPPVQASPPPAPASPATPAPTVRSGTKASP